MTRTHTYMCKDFFIYEKYQTEMLINITDTLTLTLQFGESFLTAIDFFRGKIVVFMHEPDQ